MKERKITIIYFEGDIGKTHTVEISRVAFRSLILLAFLVILLLASTATLAITFYLEKGRIASERSILQKEKEGLVNTIKDMQGSIDNLQGPAHVGRDGQKASGTASGSPLSVQDFKVADGEDGRVKRVSFDLVNNLDEGKEVEGYVVIIGEGGSPTLLSVFPKKVEVKDGTPINYKKGDSFSIRRLKRIQGTLPFQNPVNGRWKVTVFVYSTDGTPSLKKEFILDR